MTGREMAETARENVVVCDNGTGVSMVPAGQSVSLCATIPPRQWPSHRALWGCRKGMRENGEGNLADLSL